MIYKSISFIFIIKDFQNEASFAPLFYLASSFQSLEKNQACVNKFKAALPEHGPDGFLTQLI